MSFRTPVNCSTDNIGSLEKIFLDEMGAAFDSVIAQVIALEKQVAEADIDGTLDEGNALLQDLISTGGPLSSIQYLEEIPPLFGIDMPPTLENDERKIFDNTDLVLTSGAFFKKPDPGSELPDNIETLRRVYNSVGGDFDKTVAEYNTMLDASYRYKIESTIVSPLIPNKSLTLEEIRSSLGDDTITTSDYVELADKSVLVVKRKPLLIPNLSDAEIPPRFGYSISDISSSIIHKTSAKNTTSAITNWVNQGFDVELPAILDGEDPALNFDIITPLFDEVKRLSSILLGDLNLYAKRINNIDLSLIQYKIQTQLDNLDKAAKELVSTFLAEVSIIKEFDTLTKLRDRLSDSEIEYLLLNQKYVVGIDLDATENEVNNLVFSTVSQQAAGDNTASNSHLNSNFTLRDSNYAVVLLVLSDVQRALAINKNPLSAITINQMVIVLTALNNRVLVTEVTAKPPIAGYPSYTTPATIAMQRIAFNKNFKISIKFKALDDALADIKKLYAEIIGGPLTTLLKTLANVVKVAIQTINQLRDRLLQQLMPLKRKLDEFVSKYLTLIGSGDFDSSVFKCAINYNIGLSFNIFDALEALITKLAEMLSNLVAGLVGIFLDAINGIICPVLAFMEEVLGSANEYLPPFCAVNIPVLIPPEAEEALKELRRVVLFQNVAFTEYNGDLVKARAAITTAPDRLDSFRSSAGCLTQTTSSMISTTLVNVKAAVRPV